MVIREEACVYLDGSSTKYDNMIPLAPLYRHNVNILPVEASPFRKRRRGNTSETTGLDSHVEVACRKMVEEMIPQSREEMRREVEKMSSSMEEMRIELQRRSNEETEAYKKPSEFADAWLVDQTRTEVEAQVGGLEAGETEVTSPFSPPREDIGGPDAARIGMTMLEVQTRIRTEVKAQLGQLGLGVVMQKDVERLRAEIKAEITQYVDDCLDQFKMELDEYGTDVNEALDERLSYYYDGEAMDDEIAQAKADLQYELGDRDIYSKEEVDAMLEDHADAVHEEVTRIAKSVYEKEEVDEMLGAYYDAEAVDSEVYKARWEVKDELEDQIERAEEKLDDMFELRLEDRVLGITDDLQKSVRDDVRDLEQRVLKHLKKARLSLSALELQHEDAEESVNDDVRGIEDRVLRRLKKAHLGFGGLEYQCV